MGEVVGGNEGPWADFVNLLAEKTNGKKVLVANKSRAATEQKIKHLDTLAKDDEEGETSAEGKGSSQTEQAQQRNKDKEQEKEKKNTTSENFKQIRDVVRASIVYESDPAKPGNELQCMYDGFQTLVKFLKDYDYETHIQTKHEGRDTSGRDSSLGRKAGEGDPALEPVNEEAEETEEKAEKEGEDREETETGPAEKLPSRAVIKKAKVLALHDQYQHPTDRDFRRLAVDIEV